MQCSQCGAEFWGTSQEMNEKMLAEHIKMKHVNSRREEFKINSEVIEKAQAEQSKTELPPQPTVETPPAPVKREPVPIELEYRYKGQCPDCYTSVETLAIEVDEKLFMVAQCIPCRKKIKDLQVIPVHVQIAELGNSKRDTKTPKK